MSFDHKAYQSELVQHYENRLGWSEDIAKKAASIASDVVRITHGGERHYIPSRDIDRASIVKDHAAGASVSNLARSYGLSASAIRKIIR